VGGTGMVLAGGGGGFDELVGGIGTVLEGGGGGLDELVGGTGTVLEGGGGAAPPEFFLKVGGRAGGLFGFAGTSLIAPVLRNFGIPPANKPANPGGPPPIGIGAAAPPPGLLPPEDIPPPELPPVLVSIKAALRSFFSESFTFLSFLPFSIDFNKSLLPFVEGGGILATGGGGGAGTGGGGGGTIFLLINILFLY